MLQESNIIVTGLGVVSAIGTTKSAFIDALLGGHHNFGFLERPHRQRANERYATRFIGAEIPELEVPKTISNNILKSCSLSTKAALACLNEAWQDAELVLVDPERVGLIVGGSNIQQRELIQTIEKYQNRCQFIPPSYAIKFMDSDVCGVCTEVFGIQGLAHTVGGASASGQLAIIQAIQAIRCNQVDVCIALGCMQDISYLECQAFRAIGAMGSDKYSTAPDLSCRPFDRDHDGFIFGESCGAVVLEREDFRTQSVPRNYATVNGWGIAIDANRNPNSSMEGEVRAIKRAMFCSNLRPRDIDYINPHGTGSAVGDEIELNALREIGLNNAYINTTKSVIGHGLSSAGTAEVIATLLQMQQSQLHPCLNLKNPLYEDFNWVHSKADAVINQALCLSYGFGGINTALCFQRS